MAEGQIRFIRSEIMILPQLSGHVQHETGVKDFAERNHSKRGVEEERVQPYKMRVVKAGSKSRGRGRYQSDALKRFRSRKAQSVKLAAIPKASLITNNNNKRQLIKRKLDESDVTDEPPHGKPKVSKLDVVVKRKRERQIDTHIYARKRTKTRSGKHYGRRKQKWLTL